MEISTDTHERCQIFFGEYSQRKVVHGARVGGREDQPPLIFLSLVPEFSFAATNLTPGTGYGEYKVYI